MPHLRKRSGRWLAGAAVASSLLLFGCADGVDLNGKVFDWMGLSPASQEARRHEPKIAERAPLVVPPNVTKLPDPSSETAPDPSQAAWPDDPEQRKVREAKERERLHLAHCRGEAQWKERALSKEANPPSSPYGPCPSLFSGAISNINKN